MAVFRCKMCGGALDVNVGDCVAVCECCGTRQTLPRLDDERRGNLYDRANHFRRNNEFDKAMSIYEQILNEDRTDAEAYWSLVLCRYGIEYVEDPASRRRLPTVNRAQFTSVFDDSNYKSALQYADPMRREIYEAEARAINEIQKGILAISQKEAPFDVFICYKETDHNGRRTPDSVLANELYHQLVQEGFKVFFSRITLEDKLGSAYEPYIFAALNSAKVMVVLGTRAEYFNAVWVKNEWSRYLSLIKQGAKKILIPAYRDMDPYDLPEEFSHLQAQDMSKLGFMQDLIRGIQKIAQPNGSVSRPSQPTTTANIAPLLERAFMFLEDGEWDRANEFCEQVLNQDPKNTQAYLGKLMVDLKVQNADALKDQAEPFDKNSNYQKALRFGDETLKALLIGAIEHINTRNESARLEDIYAHAHEMMCSREDEGALSEAARLFNSIATYKDSDTLAQECVKKAETARNNDILARAADRIKQNSLQDYQEAIRLLETISGWKNADELVQSCRESIKSLEELARQKKKKTAKRRKVSFIAAAGLIVIIVTMVLLVNSVIIPNAKYNEAISLMESKKYAGAIGLFERLDGYKDSEDQILECRYRRAVLWMEEGKYTEAISAFDLLNEYKDSSSKAHSCSLALLKQAEVGDCVTFGEYEQDNNTSNGKEKIEWLVLTIEDDKMLVISKYALDCKPFNVSYINFTWENSSLREWLNDEFLDSAFSSAEQTKIPYVTVVTEANPEYQTTPGNETEDQVFLLSFAETEKYFKNITLECQPTIYALANGAYVYDGNGDDCTFGTCWWWLRSLGGTSGRVASVNYYGLVYSYGKMPESDHVGVRPAMWIDLNAI